jgi:hypothetical protein
MRMSKSVALMVVIAMCSCVLDASAQSLRNDVYEITLLKDKGVQVTVKGLPPQTLSPRFTVMFSEKDPGYHRNHQNYFLAPRTAIRWPNYQEDAATLNAWLKTDDALSSTGMSCTVSDDAKGLRTWLYKDAAGKTQKVSGQYALGTVNPFHVGRAIELEASGATLTNGVVRWTFAGSGPVNLSAEVSLPSGDADPSIIWKMNTSAAGYYSVIYTGAPVTPASEMLPLAQECAGRGFKQANFVVCEGDLKLPRAHVATKAYNSALVIDAKEGPFRLVDDDNSRFGLMFERKDGQVRPMALAPLMGGPESKMKAGASHAFTLRYVLKGGDWKDTYRHIARKLYRFRDQRDNTGAGSINDALANLIDYITDRNGKNYAMWHDEQKYFDYWNDKTGVFKPFSPLYGLSAAIITDDESFYRKRALPVVEFAVSRRNNIFSPYELFDNKMISNPVKDLGAPYPPLPQIVALNDFFQDRTSALATFAQEAKANKSDFVDSLALHRLTGEAPYLAAAKKIADAALKRGDGPSGPPYMDWLEMYEATKDRRYLDRTLERAYDALWEYNVSPAVPDENVVMDKGGKVPIHAHSFGRHKLWGFPEPESFPYKEQAVPAWRPAVSGLISDAYRGGLWMHNHGQFMRVAGLTGDDMLRDVARWGWVGRFGNYNGDNRSSLSLITESPDAVENPIWKLTYSTVNPGHSWEFVGEMLDFIVSDAFQRSGGKIDFPSESMHGTSFQVKTYGAKPGTFYDDQDVRLWLPRKLLTIDNKQFDYLAGYGNGKLYLAIWNQSFKDESANVTVNDALAPLGVTSTARVWKDNKAATKESLAGKSFKITVPAKGIIAYAIDGVAVKTQLHSKMTDPSAPKLGKDSLIRSDAPFGKVHGMLLSMGKGLTTAFIYTEAPPEEVISAKLRYRQGGGAWTEKSDEIFPFEFSFDYDESKPPLEFQFEVENVDQQIQKSQILTIKP